VTATCKRCGGDAADGVTPYWATDGHRLCPSCAMSVAAELDRRDKWPEVPWTEDDERALAGWRKKHR
jgi:hypothetical protein